VVGRKQTKIAFFFILFNLLLLIVACTSSKATDYFYYTTDSIQTGDIILRKSYGLISEIVVTQLHDSLNISHCGILLKDSGSVISVIHSLSKKVSDTDGVQICDLEDFLNDSHLESVKIVRYRNNPKIIAESAVGYLNRRVPFDEEFNSKDTSAMFCSELPIHIIRSIDGVDISNGAAKPKFSIFLNENFFREIPFVKFSKSRN